jgi:hypothetical protein
MWAFTWHNVQWHIVHPFGGPFFPAQVQPAKFEPKSGVQPRGKPGGGGGGGGMSKKQKAALQARQERLLGWGGLDDKLPAEKVRGNEVTGNVPGTVNGIQ